MTGFGIGMRHVRRRAAATAADQTQPVEEDVAVQSAASAEPAATARDSAGDTLRIVLDWVPVEILGAYAALITALGGDTATGSASGGWLVLFCVLGAVSTFLGATAALRAMPVAARRGLGRGLALRALFSALQVFVWSWMLPGSATNRSEVGRQNGAAVVVLVLLGAVVLGLLAQYTVELSEVPRPARRRTSDDVGEDCTPHRTAEYPTPAVGSGEPGGPSLAVVAADDDGRDQTRLLCASYLAASVVPDGPLPDSPTLAYLTESAPIQQSDPLVLSAWGSGLRCLVVNTLGGVIVAFGAALPEPGADARRTVTDWIGAVDADLIVHRWFPGRVHAGFAAELDRLWDRLDQQLRSRLALCGPGATLWMTGHGIGGGLANLAAARFASQSVGRLRVRTFGGARPGDGEFATAYARLVPDSLRLEYGNDLVPHLPLGIEFAGRLGNLEFIDQLGVYLHRDFRAVGTLRYTALDGSVVADSDPLKLTRHRSLAAVITSENFAALITDHDGRPGGGYFRTLHHEVGVRPCPPIDRPADEAESRGPTRRWPRRERRNNHLRAADAGRSRASAGGS